MSAEPSIGPSRLPLRLAAVASASLGSAITGLVVWGHRDQPFYMQGLDSVLGIPWGGIMAVDFLAALLCVGAWIVALERNKLRGVTIAVVVIILGTPVALFYFAMRAWNADSWEEWLLGTRSG